jgi:raffinose/stachyose/melibiose transport system permease protein
MGSRARSWKSLEKREFVLALVSVLVPFTLFFIVVYLPQLTNLFFSFTNWDGYSREFRMVGLANFRKFFTYQPILSAMGNTFLFTGCVTVLGAVTQLGMALVLSRGLRGSSFFKAAFYLPLLFSWVVLAIIWNSILRNNGLLNSFLRTAGLAMLARDWLATPGTAMGSLIFLNTWCGFGYGLIIFLAGLNSIPPEVREAADGVPLRDSPPHHVFPHDRPLPGHRDAEHLRPGICHDGRRACRRHAHRGPCDLRRSIPL